MLFALFHKKERELGEDDVNLGLRWLVPLWTHRDAEMRAAGLDAVGQFTVTSKGCRLIASNMRQISGKDLPFLLLKNFLPNRKNVETFN